ncbi:MAG TPA: S8 family serine peptidase [Actinomycetota bacterium]|nr:S8 family serine peptidase [Actinomycetota bacterium]
MRARRGILLVSFLLLALGLPVIEAGGATTGRYIVALRDDADPEDTARAHRDRYGVEAGRYYRNAFRGYAATIHHDRVDDLRKDPSVRAVMEDRPYRAAQTDCNPTQTECLPNGVNRIDAEATSATGNGIEVAVMDSGIDLDHPDLQANILGGVDCDGPDNGNFDDQHAHGTHVAGTIAALDNNTGVRGVAPQAKLWAVRILNAQGIGSGESILCGLEFVYDKAIGNPNPGGNIRVANMSIEKPAPNIDAHADCGQTVDDIVHMVICDIVDFGVTFVVAAGNGADDIKDVAPAAYDEVITATALSDWDGAPCGGATDPPPLVTSPDDTFSEVSSYASSSADRAHTIGAPGEGILSTWINGYAYNTGTSMSAPHIAGVVAQYLQTHLNATPAQVLTALKETGEPLGVNSGEKCPGTTASHTDPSGLHPEPVVCGFGCFLPPEAATPGVVRGIYWYLNNAFDSSANIPRFAYGNSTDRVVAGDWNEDGIDSPGVVRGNIWYLNDDRDGSGNIAAFAYGNPSDKIVVGDWNQDGIDSAGVIRGNIWYLNNDRDGSNDVPAFAYGASSDRVIAGDWDGDGVDSPGVVRNGIWYLNNDRDGTADVAPFGFGNSLDTPIVGDWDGDGDEDIGVRRGLTWFLRIPGLTGPISFAYGNATDRFVVGDWDGPNP